MRGSADTAAGEPLDRFKPTSGASANPFAPPKSPRDTAKEAIIEEKTKKEVAEVTKRAKINVPDDFPVKAPETPQLPPGMGASPHGDMGGEGEAVPPPPPAENNSAKPKAAPGGKKK